MNKDKAGLGFDKWWWGRLGLWRHGSPEMYSSTSGGVETVTQSLLTCNRLRCNVPPYQRWRWTERLKTSFTSPLWRLGLKWRRYTHVGRIYTYTKTQWRRKLIWLGLLKIIIETKPVKKANTGLGSLQDYSSLRIGRWPSDSCLEKSRLKFRLHSCFRV